MLLVWVWAYLIGTIGMGLYAARRVKNTADFAIAGRSLPLVMVITTTFATWFGSETVLGIPAKFIQTGLHGVVEDPFGASLCLILVGTFFAKRLYRMKLLTISDYYRERYGRSVEVACSVIIMLSYLGWVCAQVTALGLVFQLLSGGTISLAWGMALGVFSILAYTLFGGMWSVALTDFVQMIVLVLGLSILAIFATHQAGGTAPIWHFLQEQKLLSFWPQGPHEQSAGWREWVFFIGAGITMMLGSIPQQDVFQRVMSAKDEKAATRGPLIGGLCYLFFAFVPIFLVASSFLIMPTQAWHLLGTDPQRILPTLVLEHMPFVMQVLFFGALLSAIKSAASATLLAPSITFVENIFRQFYPDLSDRQALRAMQLTVLVFAACVLGYAIAAQGTSIYELVSTAYQLPLVGAFVPLTAGLYWARASTQGAIGSIGLGVGTWLLFLMTSLGTQFPAQLAGLLAALAGMAVGSFLPPYIPSVQGRHRRLKTVGGVLPLPNPPP
jgi:SSS family solute:Na+ symporter